MQAGRLRHKVQLQNYTKASDGAGGYTHTWSTAETVWADIRPLSARDELSAGQVQENVTHNIVLRYTANVTHETRIVFGSRTFQVVSVRNWDERNEMLLLRVKEETR